MVAGSIPAGGSITFGALDSNHRQQIFEHLCRLSPEDRYMRFCSATTDSFIERYVYTVMDLDRDFAYACFDGDRVVGMAHIAFVNYKSCELAFSIDLSYRGRGLARLLMRASIELCQQMGVKKLCMSCLRNNAKMRALAESFGLGMTITYDEAYAELGITK